MGTYTLFVIASAAEVGLFGQTFLDGIGVGNVDWLIIGIVAMVFIAIFAFGDIRVATRTLLSLEGISVTLILVLIVVIFAKVIGGSAPSDQGFTLSVFSPASGISLSAIAVASVFGFLSFGGFEGAASLGEETDDPGRNIPRAILIAVIAAGTFYVVCMVAQSLGFGLSDAGIKRFSESSGPLGDLGKDYIGSGFADVINFGATMSAFAAALGAATAASRILFAIARDGFPGNPLGRASARSGAPAGALTVILAVVADRDGGLPDQRHERRQRLLLSRHDGRAADAGQLLRLQHRRDRVPLLPRRAARAGGEIVVPLIALAIIVYVLYQNTLADSLVSPYTKFPLVVGAWLLLGLLIALFVPNLARRIGEGLAREEGMKPR